MRSGRVEELLKAGSTWVVDADLKSYFDTIPHGQLMAHVAEKIADGRVLDLIRAFLKQGVLSEGKELVAEAGTPQGGVISPLLANIYLDPLDRQMAQAGYEMVRYADDFVILCRSEDEALSALDEVRQWTAQAGLVLHPEKTRIVDWAASDGFDFLGYHFGSDRKWPSRKSLKKFKDAIRAQTGRNNGQSLRAIIADLNRLLSGWFEYFKHAHHYLFKSLDSWIRMRLRSTLRRRQGRRGRSRGTDQVRWPNAYFEARGLYSLASAHARASILSEVKPLTGEPDAGNPPVRFRREGEPKPIGSPYPYILPNKNIRDREPYIRQLNRRCRDSPVHPAPHGVETPG